MVRALIIYVLELRVENIFNHIGLFFHGGRGTYECKAVVIKFCPNADCGYPFIHRLEHRDKMPKSLINHKSASESMFSHMAAVIYIAICQPLHPYPIDCISCMAVMFVLHFIGAFASCPKAPTM